MSNSGIESIGLERRRENINIYLLSLDQFYQHRYEQAIKPHRLQFNAIIYIASGRGEHFIDYKKYKLKPGTLICLSRYQVHQFCFNPDVTGYVLSFDDESMFSGNDDSLKDLITTTLTAINTLQDPELSQLTLFQTLWHECNGHDLPWGGEISRSLLRTIILKSLVREYHLQKNQQTGASRSTTFYQLKSMIDVHFRHSRNVKEYARTLGKSCKQLNKVARENTGHTVKELLDHRLLVELKRLLAFSHHSITDIALKLGFNEATNMTKFFRRHTQLSPKQFRLLCRQNELNG